MVFEDANPFYLGAFVVYLLVVLLIGLWANTQSDSKEDFWIFGNDLGKWLATWSLVANFFSAVALIGTVGQAAQVGYVLATAVSLGLILGIVGFYFISHRIRKLNMITFPDIVAEITNREYARPITGFILLLSAWIFLVMQLVGSGFLITTITGVSYENMVWLIGFVFIAYTVLGGLVSVAWTDLVQGTIMVALIVLSTGYLIADLGGITAVNQQFAEINPAAVQPLGGGVYSLVGAIGSILAFFGSIFVSQALILRINATKDVKTTKFHLAVGGFIISIFLVTIILLSAGTAVALESAGLSVSNPDQMFPLLITEYFPTVIGTVIILGIMGAILSTTDSLLHAIGVTFARDIYDYFRPGTPDSHQLQVSRASTVVFGVLAILISINPPGTVFALYEFRALFITSALLIPVYGALYWHGVAQHAVLASMIAGAVGSVGSVAAGVPLPPTIVGVAAAALVLVGGHVVLNGRQAGVSVSN
ncbi:sodium:solute symporter family protein [Natrialbaceae archaeon A-gly3]